MNWVRARMEWSTEAAWTALQKQIEEDSAAWKDLVGEARPPRAHIHKEANKMLITHRGWQGELQASVKLTRTDEAIQVARYDPVTREHDASCAVSLIAKLNFKGEARFFNRDEELELWQASRLILEPVLF